MFKYILGFSAFTLASCAAFFSIKGIALLFAASFWSVVIMAGSMELAKLISASYLYRYWDDMNKILKRYMVIAVVLLMIITSLGIFGFLSDAFQRNFSQYSFNVSKIDILKSQQTFTLSQIDFNKNKLKDLIGLQKTYQSSLDNASKQDVIITKTTEGGFFSSQKTEKIADSKLIESKNKIIESSQQNIGSLFNQISGVTQDLRNLENQNSTLNQEILNLESDNTKGEIGTFKFIAEAFNLKIETAVRIFIVLIMIVFDPLAVCLVIAYNSVVRNSSIKNSSDPVVVEKIIEKIIEKPVDRIKHIFHSYKRGTKKTHNPEFADPNLPENQTDKYIRKTYKN
jgi:hypothetical protein